MTAGRPQPERRRHLVKHNTTERIPARWIVADTESRERPVKGGTLQTLRCFSAVRWRTDLKTDERREWLRGTGALAFWEWVTAWTHNHGRTVLWFHNASYDLRTLDAFAILPGLGFELVWCNLDRDVSVATFRGAGRTLVIADTWTWTAQPLAKLAPYTGVRKPPLPAADDSDQAWQARCDADVQITEQVVRRLLQFVTGQHLGNWQPSGAGMGLTTWRHRFLDHKVIVHDDVAALKAERRAMWAGRAEAWWHGPAAGGPFTEWDMHMSYCRIAAECDLPRKLWGCYVHPTKKAWNWLREDYALLAETTVNTQEPVVPADIGGRIGWPVGQFRTTLWDVELDQVTASGGSYTVHRCWAYRLAPILRGWAEWSLAMCGLSGDHIDPIARFWVKHQSRAVIGRIALRTPTWELWGGNPLGQCEVTQYQDLDTGQKSRMLHVGAQTFLEGPAKEADGSLPQITGYIMAVARARLWDACQAAGPENVLHVDTDSLIVNARGSAALELAVTGGLPGGWRPKEQWRRIDVTAPRHYRTEGRRMIPGVPLGAVETAPGRFEGEIWQSLAAGLSNGYSAAVQVSPRTWRPKDIDHRRPWTGPGPGQPITLPRKDGPPHEMQTAPAAPGRGRRGLG